MGDIFKREIIRPVVTLLIPGVIGFSPFVFLLASENPRLHVFIEGNAGPALSISLIFATVLGMIFEDVGSSIEKLWDSKLELSSRGQHLKTWKSYLSLSVDNVPIAHRYLRSVLLRYKFELSMIPAITTCWVGLLLLRVGSEPVISYQVFGVGTVTGIVLLGYLLEESFSSADLLAQLRIDIVEWVKNEEREMTDTKKDD